MASGKKRRRQDVAAAGAAAQQQQQFASPEKSWCARRLRAFQKKLPLRPGLQESWLGQRVLANGQERWRCKICDEFCGPCFRHLSVRHEQARLANLQRHARTKAHRSAVKAYIQRLSPKMAQIGAFPPEDFQAVWHRWGGRLPKRTISIRKRFTIEWCIFEAVRD